MSTSLSSQKQITLDKYKEQDEDLDIIEDTSELSYSKFSHLSGTNIKNGSESPFVTKIQNKLQDIKFKNDIRLNSGSGSSSSSNKIYPIEEEANINDENFPFKPPLRSFVSQSTPDRIILPKTRAGNITAIQPESTPKHLRNPSVKVSLTPAQRVERRPDIRSKNALENFQFGEMVGRGAFATVYKGINLRTNQIVAIKQMLLEKEQDVQDLMGEIDLLKILKHPNIVKYHGFVKTSNSLNVFLEFCAGGSLRQLYKRMGSGIPEPDIISHVKSILNGLNYLHEQGVVHRDVKAANVLITETGDIKLADFGVATKVTNQYLSVVGTPNWMAPETVLGGEGICTASDIWSLGATIIELFTTNPPYHNLNPMATLHAIGTDDHPPIPKNISTMAKDFLLECFQKQPSLRKTAQLLLKHKWLSQKVANTPETQGQGGQRHLTTQISNIKSINSYSENYEDNWEKDFSEMSNSLTKNEKLQKFAETNEGESFIEELIIKDDIGIQDLGSEDPFLDIEVENFDTNELAVQSKMEFLVTKLSKRVDLCQNGNEEVMNSLIKVVGKIAHLVKKYPVSHDALIRDHGIVCIFELLENCNENSELSRLWYYCLVTLNYIFESNISQFENFCLLGGIPVITKFRSNKYDNSIKLQVVRFIRNFLNSHKALAMFISCGGLRVLAKFAEEDFDTNPQFPIISIQLIHIILTKDLSNSKSDLCRKLSHYGIIFWYIVLLHRLTKFNDDKYSEIVDQIISIVKYFGQSEVKVRINISSPDLYKLLLKAYPKLSVTNQLTVLKFIKSMSCVRDILNHLQSAEILEFLVGLIKQKTPSTDHYKEFLNIICPVLYNCCYLNHSKEIELVRLGALPYLRDLAKINLPFKQFVLPILCELVYCDQYVRGQLVKYNISDVYLNLLVDPYWQANSLDSILNWYKQDPTVKLISPRAISCLTSGFILNKVSNLESALDNYLKLITINPGVSRHFCKNNIFHNILQKMTNNMKNPVVQLMLLKILKVLLNNKGLEEEICSEIERYLKGMEVKSLLVDELVSEVLTILR